MHNLFSQFYSRSSAKIEKNYRDMGRLDRMSQDVVHPISSDMILSRYPGLSPFFRSLHRVIYKFDYVDTTSDNWNKYYVLPDSLSLWVDKFNIPTDEDPVYINLNNVEIERWFDFLAKQCCPSGRDLVNTQIRYFVTGEIGCGKSTFLKRGIKNYYSRFRENKVIPFRVEFSKIRRSRSGIDSKDIESLRLSIIDSMFREIHHFFGDFENKLSFVDDPIFSETFRHFLHDKFLNIPHGFNYSVKSSDANDFVDYNIAKSKRFFNLDRDDRKMEVYNSDIIFKELSIYFAYKMGFRFLCIFDGFDYLTAADYLYKTDNSIRISQLNEIHKGANYFPLLIEIGYPLDFHQIYVMRDVTYSRFIERNPGVYENSYRRHFRIASPSSKALVARAISRVSEDLGLPDMSAAIWTFDKIMRRLLRDAIVKGDSPISASSDQQFSKNSIVPINLFNGNARKELHFILFIIRWLAREVLPEADLAETFADAPSELFRVVEKEDFLRVLRSKQYRLLALLLCRDTTSFRNSLMLPHTDEGEEFSLFEREGIGNYVDNIYNYDEMNNAPFSLVSKIRVCELLRNNPLTSSEIQSILGEQYAENTKRLLAIMCRTGLLKTRWKNANVLFQTEPLGLLCIDHLVHKTEYIEHIFPHITIPQKIRDFSVPVFNREKTKSIKWATASLINNFILLKYLEYVEKEERRSGFSWKWITPTLRQNHTVTTEKTLKRFNMQRSEIDFQVEEFLKKFFES